MAENLPLAFILLTDVLPLNLGGKTIFISHLTRCDNEVAVPEVKTAVLKEREKR